MAQSYGIYTSATVATPTDSITGVTSIEQKLGTSISGAGPMGFIASSTLNVYDNGITYALTLAPSANIYDICSSIQAQVIAGGDLNFTARYNSGLDQIILSSGTVGTAASKCSVTGGTAAVPLKLGTVNGGTESFAGSEVITYFVTYLFVYEGTSYGAGSVVVHSSDMTIPTNLAQMESIANSRAAQLKRELTPGFGVNPPAVVNSTNAINGPVVLNA